MKPIMYLLSFLGGLACLGFIYGIIKACSITWRHGDPAQMPAYLTSVVVSISAVLGTNLGAVLGIATTNQQSSFRRVANWNPFNLFTSETATVAQITACYAYIAGMLACAVTWAAADFNPDTAKIVSLIPQLAQSLLGVIVGAIAVYLKGR